MSTSTAVTSFRLSAVFLMTGPFVCAQLPINSLCSTGLTQKSALPIGCNAATLVTPINPFAGGPIVDGNWRLATPYPSAPVTDRAPDPCTTSYSYDPAPVNAPDIAWYNPNDGLSQWISPLGGRFTPAGWYIYRTSFVAPVAYQGYPRYALNIQGQFSADNQVRAVYLLNRTGDSSRTCGRVAGFTGTDGFASWNQFQVSGSVIPETEGFLFFVVFNANTAPTENPTGLRVEFLSSYFSPY